MNVRIIKIGFACFLAIVPKVALPEITVSIQKLETSAHGHHFYSEKIQGSHPSITYLVCNKTDKASDFFWESVGFGLGEEKPLLAHHCVEKVDFASVRNKPVPSAFEDATRVQVLDEIAEVPTVLWCNFGSMDRCNPGVVGDFGVWISTLRVFGDGGTKEAFAPLLAMGVQPSDGGYLLQISRSIFTGQLVVIALGAPTESVIFFPTDGVEAKVGPLSEFISLSGQSIFSGLTPRLSAIEIFSDVGVEPGTELYVQSTSTNDLRLVLISIDASGSVARLDSMPLPAQSE